MKPHLPILGLDTSGPHCSVSILGAVTPNAYEPMKRGQAERLIPMCEEVLTSAKMDWTDLKTIAVGIGPGNFTGIRIGVSAARGLALGLGIPAVGVSGFQQLLQGRGYSTRVLAALPAPRDQAFVQLFLAGKALAAPKLITIGEDHDDLRQPNLCVVGYEAVRIATGLGADADVDAWPNQHPEMTAANIALIASNMMDAPDFTPSRPAPLYVKAADAAPPRDPAPVILP